MVSGCSMNVKNRSKLKSTVMLDFLISSNPATGMLSLYTPRINAQETGKSIWSRTFFNLQRHIIVPLLWCDSTAHEFASCFVLAKLQRNVIMNSTPQMLKSIKSTKKPWFKEKSISYARHGRAGCWKNKDISPYTDATNWLSANTCPIGSHTVELGVRRPTTL